jgi:hypothetical protein
MRPVATAYNLIAIPVAAGVFVHWGFDLPMSGGGRDEPVHYHRGCKRATASPTEPAARDTAGARA